MWNGRPNLRCRELAMGELTDVQLLDLETSEELSGLPRRFVTWRDYEFGADTAFVERCFGRDGNALADDLQPEERRKLARILRQVAYGEFLKRLEAAEAEAPAAPNEHE